MYAKLLGVLLFACQIIFNESHEIHPVTAQIPVINVTVAIPVGYHKSSDNQVAYKLHQERLLWNKARERCISEGGHLAITDSVSKMQRIINMRGYWGTRWLHGSIYRSNTTGQWVQTDNGVPVTNIPWRDGSPQESRDCTGMWIGAEPGLRNFYCEGHAEWFVCEITL